VEIMYRRGAIVGALCALLSLASACGGGGQSANARTTFRATATAVPIAVHVVAWPPQAVAALKKPWIEGCATSPERGTSKGKCTILFDCLEASFSVTEFTRLTVGYFAGGGLPTRDRPAVVACFARAHLHPTG
jgi:hypothetical protein